MQVPLFPDDVPQPLVVAYGMGVDSTATLVQFTRLVIRPDLILFANVGGPYFDARGCEKEETYAYRAVINEFLAKRNFPTVTTVWYTPKNFKNWPPYYSLEENCLTNGTLPSKAFGFGSCSQKWKAAPQDKFLKTWKPALRAWAAGKTVKKVIGYDCGPRDLQRYTKAEQENDPRYEFWYPLLEWGWDRERCIEEIRREGLPVPPKSSCFFCPSMKPWEVEQLPESKLKRLVLMEARAQPRLVNVQGLWRKATKKRPGSMTEYIRQQGLLPAAVIDRIVEETPTEIIRYQEAYQSGQTVLSFSDYLVEQLEEIAA